MSDAPEQQARKNARTNLLNGIRDIEAARYELRKANETSLHLEADAVLRQLREMDADLVQIQQWSEEHS